MLEQATSPARPEKVLQRVNQIAAFVAGSIIMVMMVLTVIDVFLRYVFRKPLIWNFDLQTTLIVMLVFLGIAYVQNQRRHIIVDVLVARLSRLNRVWFQLSNDILFLCFTFLVCWQSTVQAQE